MADDNGAVIAAQLIVLRVFMTELLFILAQQKDDPPQAVRDFIARLHERMDSFERLYPENAAHYERARQSIDLVGTRLLAEWDRPNESS